MSDSNTDLLARIDKLETSNRRLKTWGGVLLGAVGIVGLMGMAAPMVCNTVWAERFVMNDSNGNKRLMLDAYTSGTPTVSFYNKGGKALASLSVDNKGEAALDLFQGGKKHTTTLRLDDSGNPYFASAAFTKGTSCEGTKSNSCGEEGSAIN